MIGHFRIRVAQGKVEILPALSYSHPFTKSNKWTDIRVLSVPFNCIKDVMYEYRANSKVTTIAKDYPSFNLWTNGSFISGSAILGETIVNGKKIANDIVGKTEKRSSMYFEGGKPSIGRPGQLTNIKFAAQAGPVILDKGIVTALDNAKKENIQSDVGSSQTQPRTLFGIDSIGKRIVYCWVDGRGPSDNGLGIDESGHLMKALGCQKAINMDGGGSTVIYTNNSKLQAALDMKNSYHIADTRFPGIIERVVSHGIGFNIDINKLLAIPKEEATMSDISKYKVQAEVTADLNGVMLSEPGLLINNRSYYPIRVIANAIGADVKWNQSTNHASLTTKK